MVKSNLEKTMIGRAIRVSLPTLTSDFVHARVDTGARTCAIWASSVRITEGKLHVIFWGPGSRQYTGETFVFEDFGTRLVASSTGVTEHRYTVRLKTVIAGRRVRATFTLADRSAQAYPILIGRNVLNGKFIVDVSQGEIDIAAEKERNKILQSEVRREAKS